jgi:hypothetical protein
MDDVNLNGSNLRGERAVGLNEVDADSLERVPVGARATDSGREEFGSSVTFEVDDFQARSTQELAADRPDPLQMEIGQGLRRGGLD